MQVILLDNDENIFPVNYLCTNVPALAGCAEKLERFPQRFEVDPAFGNKEDKPPFRLCVFRQK
jgi:hypothetical protein